MTYKNPNALMSTEKLSENIDDPNISDLNELGTMARIMRLFKMPDGSITIIIQGLTRFNLKSITGAL